MESAESLLSVRSVQAGYGPSQVLFDVNLTVLPGQCVSLQGRNGMGKTTTIRTIFGMLPCLKGQVQFRGTRIDEWPAYQIARAGLGLVPEGRQIFPNLTVWENLVATARDSNTGLKNWNLDRVMSLFPKLAGRRNNFGNQLSGGEQQMLAIGRALMTNPVLLVLDEATEGLAPVIRQEIWTALDALRTEGMSILITDKNLKHLLHLCDRHYILEKGVTVWEGDTPQFQADTSLRQRYLAT
ncbi:ABC transporter ATP-binding protein [Orrella marina]|uniref:ABC transporter ATP-binding protein n=1 Tax=Orrella marina TaxID=2163011 RepID=A0A2R4XK36_9BURK|nr:ABC transporter ATP-binding protein [Orrella marina]AWB34195.1 ABC transporter ATP-binding protein [Orrella marina]